MAELDGGTLTAVVPASARGAGESSAWRHLGDAVVRPDGDLPGQVGTLAGPASGGSREIAAAGTAFQTRPRCGQ
jgi:hypothetical protein